MANDHRNCEFRKEELTVDCVTTKETTDMAPKDDKSDKNKPDSTILDNSNDTPEIAEEDLQEIASVNDNLDSLNSALDVIEQRADDIRAKLMELLTSNREIYQSMKEENQNSKPNDTEESS